MAFGFQFEINLGFFPFGFEVVIPANLSTIYYFGYCGCSISGSDLDKIPKLIQSAILNITKSPLSVAETIFRFLGKNITMSFSLFAVYRFWKTSFSVSDYLGPFYGASFVIPTSMPLIGIKVYTSYSSTYFVCGLGIISPGNVLPQVSQTNYYDCTKLLRPYFSFLNKMLTKIRTLAKGI